MYNSTLKMDLFIYHVSRIWLYILRKMVLIVKKYYILKTQIHLFCIVFKNVHNFSFIMIYLKNVYVGKYNIKIELEINIL